MRTLIKHVDNTSLFIAIFFVLSMSFFGAMMYRQHRLEEEKAANSEKPCWNLEYINGP
jgi:hypothetical protein